jgi:hypothetical protein
MSIKELKLLILRVSLSGYPVDIPFPVMGTKCGSVTVTNMKIKF